MNYLGYMIAVGIVVLVAGLVLLAIEAHASTAGVLAALGLLALAGGAALAVAGAGGGAVAATATGVAIGAAAGAGALAASRRLARARGGLPHGGASGLVGHCGHVREWEGRSGRVLVDGALWRARGAFADEAMRAGDAVVVDAVDGLTLAVHRADELEVSR